MRTKIPSIIGLVILVFGMAAGVFLVSRDQVFRLGATGDVGPQDLRISNVGDNSFTVSWITDRETIGYVNWGQTASLGNTESTDLQNRKRVHSVTISGLSPTTTYYFTINSAGKDFDNNAIPWTVTTGPQLQSPVGSMLISGTVVTDKGTPAQNVLVYVNSGGMAQLSTLTSENGSWTIPLSSARDRSLASYANIDPSRTVLDIFVQGGATGVSTAQIHPEQANPAPNIILGESHDFRSESSTDAALPEARIDLPEGEPEDDTDFEGFDLSSETPENTDEVVTLESIKEEGEVVFTESPEFFGEGPAGATVTITVESDPVTDTVTVGNNGLWRWSPPSNLPDGVHRVTISWRDAQGFLRTLTRSFVVQASEGEPSFQATPSGSTASTPTPSPTPVPTPTPTPKPISTPTPTAIPTPRPTVSASPTPSPKPTASPIAKNTPTPKPQLPEAGSTAATLVLVGVGLALLFSGIVISRKQFN